MRLNYKQLVCVVKLTHIHG